MDIDEFKHFIQTASSLTSIEDISRIVNIYDLMSRLSKEAFHFSTSHGIHLYRDRTTSDFYYKDNTGNILPINIDDVRSGIATMLPPIFMALASVLISAKVFEDYQESFQFLQALNHQTLERLQDNINDNYVEKDAYIFACDVLDAMLSRFGTDSEKKP